MRHQPIATANAAAITTAIIYIFCRLAFAIAPDISLSVGKTWFHGIDIGKIAASTGTLDSFFLGFITIIIFAWIVGYTFAFIFNLFAKEH